MEMILVALVAFLVAILTFFSGFGLGTILTPVFMIFFPVPVAIALTGVVHFFNNIFKMVLVGRQADWNVFFRFGIPAILASFLGSWILVHLDVTTPWVTYTIWGYEARILPFKLLVACLLMVFALIDLIPYFKGLTFDQSKLPIGGFLSGFFGGLTGNQGALRAAFLVKAGMTKEAFIGTTVLVSTCVDITRLGMYASKIFDSGLIQHWPMIVAATSAGIAGSFLGNQLLKKVTLHFVQVTVAILLILLALALGLGIL